MIPVKVTLVTLNRSLACKVEVDIDACGDVLHAVVACVNAQRGGFSGFAHAADPVQISLRMLREKDACPDFDTY